MKVVIEIVMKVVIEVVIEVVVWRAFRPRNDDRKWHTAAMLFSKSVPSISMQAGRPYGRNSGIASILLFCYFVILFTGSA